mmetsp:Transcript_37271/g.85485  ORF Transcript_37271/g.85485 Transcript_37271/m.85485 type:complete len:165 (+) Transcript_37271:17-511(+)
MPGKRVWEAFYADGIECKPTAVEKVMCAVNSGWPRNARFIVTCRVGEDHRSAAVRMLNNPTGSQSDKVKLALQLATDATAEGGDGPHQSSTPAVADMSDSPESPVELSSLFGDVAVLLDDVSDALMDCGREREKRERKKRELFEINDVKLRDQATGQRKLRRTS